MLSAITKLDELITLLEKRRMEEVSRDNLLFGVEIACRDVRVGTLAECQELVQETRAELCIMDSCMPVDAQGLKVGDVWLIQNEHGVFEVEISRLTQFCAQLRHSGSHSHPFWALVEEVTWIERTHTGEGHERPTAD